MYIKSLVVLLGVAAALLCLANAAVTVTNCDSSSAIVLQSLTISPGGNIPLSGGARTISGSLAVNVGSSQVSQVNVQVPFATASVSFLNLNLCNRDELRELCASAGRDVTCNQFQTLMGVTGICDSSGNFVTATHTVDPESVTIPSVSSLPLSGNVKAKVVIKAGTQVVGCTVINVPVN